MYFGVTLEPYYLFKKGRLNLCRFVIVQSSLGDLDDQLVELSNLINLVQVFF